MAITGTPAALASARTSPNRSGMVFRCSRARAACEQFILARNANRPDIADVLIIDVGLDLLPEVGLILDDSGDDQAPAAQASDLDGQMDTLVRVNPAQKNQVIAARFLKAGTTRGRSRCRRSPDNSAPARDRSR